VFHLANERLKLASGHLLAGHPLLDRQQLIVCNATV